MVRNKSQGLEILNLNRDFKKYYFPYVYTYLVKVTTALNRYIDVDLKKDIFVDNKNRRRRRLGCFLRICQSGFPKMNATLFLGFERFSCLLQGILT